MYPYPFSHHSLIVHFLSAFYSNYFSSSQISLIFIFFLGLETVSYSTKNIKDWK